MPPAEAVFRPHRNVAPRHRRRQPGPVPYDTHARPHSDPSGGHASRSAETRMAALHTILTSMGTDGDVFPLLGLGARLRARGHRVTLAANEHFGPLAAAQ